jgi:IS5 family transposase
MLKGTNKEGQLFKSKLSNIIDLEHNLCKMAHDINWNSLEDIFKGLYTLDKGRPGHPIRLMVSLQYLKHHFDLSDEKVLEIWLENPYWQYLSGMDYFQTKLPLDSSTMARFRKRIKKKNMEKLFEVTIKSGLKSTIIQLNNGEYSQVDTTKKPVNRIKEIIKKIARKTGDKKSD